MTSPTTPQRHIPPPPAGGLDVEENPARLIGARAGVAVAKPDANGQALYMFVRIEQVRRVYGRIDVLCTPLADGCGYGAAWLRLSSLVIF